MVEYGFSIDRKGVKEYIQNMMKECMNLRSQKDQGEI